MTTLDQQIKTLQRIKRQQRKHLADLLASEGPRYAVWYWVYDSGRQNCSMWFGVQSDNYSHAHSYAEIAKLQPCISRDNPVYIHDRLDRVDVRA